MTTPGRGNGRHRRANQADTFCFSECPLRRARQNPSVCGHMRTPAVYCGRTRARQRARAESQILAQSDRKCPPLTTNKVSAQVPAVCCRGRFEVDP